MRKLGLQIGHTLIDHPFEGWNTLYHNFAVREIVPCVGTQMLDLFHESLECLDNLIQLIFYTILNDLISQLSLAVNLA